MVMRISFSPVGEAGPVPVLELTSGDRLRVNGELFNFNLLEDGDVIPEGTIPCAWFIGAVEKVDGEVRFTIRLPHDPNRQPSQAVAFPEPITVTEDGPIAVPYDEPEQEEPADVDA